jgi:hypothetical protein
MLDAWQAMVRTHTAQNLADISALDIFGSVSTQEDPHGSHCNADQLGSFICHVLTHLQ